jgi:hypothetical protein
MLSEAELIKLQSERQYFIENGAEASLFQWLRSKGTNFTCYVEYLNSLNREQEINNKIDIVRTIIYALHKPFQFTFFYWTLLIFILHKFNFKKPVMKIILAHLILRTIGDMINKFGDLFNHYYSNVPTTDEQGNVSYSCRYDSPSTEMHPFKWFLTRQIGCIFWCLGEIVADWYPLFRTRAVAKDQSSIKIVYVTCGIFNFSKILLILYHYALSPKELYDEHGVYNKAKVDIFYFTYWIIQLIIIYASVIYDYSVYYVIKKSFSRLSLLEHGFLKRFKSVSEFRILISAVVCVIFLPIVSVTIIIKFYYYYRYGYHDLEFSFDEIRLSINNVQYFMIFIDQILLIHSSSYSTTTSSGPSNNNSYTTINVSRGISKLNFSKIINNSTNSSQYYSRKNSSSISPISPSTAVNSSIIYKNNGYSTIPNTSTIINNSIIKNGSFNERKRSEDIRNNSISERKRNEDIRNNTLSRENHTNNNYVNNNINNINSNNNDNYYNYNEANNNSNNGYNYNNSSNDQRNINNNDYNNNIVGNATSYNSNASNNSNINVSNIRSPNFGMLNSYYENDKFKF